MSENVTVPAAAVGLAGLLQALQPAAPAPAAPLDLGAVRDAAWAAGHEAGEAAAAAGLAPLRRQLADAAAALEAARAIDADALRPLLMTVVRRVAEAVLAAELRDAAGLLQPLVDAGLAAIGPGAAPTLVAHPETLASLASHLPDIAARADATLASDGFRIECGDFVVDTGLSSRLDAIMAALP